MSRSMDAQCVMPACRLVTADGYPQGRSPENEARAANWEYAQGLPRVYP
jgi:hypothetical protein